MIFSRRALRYRREVWDCLGMKLDEFRSEMESYREEAAEEAARRKDSVYVQKRMLRLYGRFDADERLMADQVINEWVLSEDESVRFTAQALIRDLKIAIAVPSLRKLAEHLAKEQTPGAPFELQKVASIIVELILTKRA